MQTQILARRRRLQILAGSLAVTLIAAVFTYGTWGYERHLAVESKILIPEMVDPTYQFAVEYRKRYRFLPGSSSNLVAVTQAEIEAMRSDAVATYDWSHPELVGTTYAYTADFTPQPGMIERESSD